MSITAYIGLPRSGKTFSVVERVVLPAVRSGRRVVHNLPLVVEAFEESERALLEFVDVSQAADDWWASVGDGCVLIIDEAWRVWPSGRKGNQIPEAQRALLAEHGHRTGGGHGMEVVLVIQDLSQLAAYVRALIEVTYLHRKLSVVGQAGRYRCDVYDRPVGLARQGVQPIRQLFGSYREEVWRYYRTHTQASDEVAVDEATVDQRARVWGAWLVRLGAPLAAVLVLGGVGYLLWWFGGSWQSGAATVAVGVAGSAVGAPVSARSQKGFGVGVESSEWRLVGLVEYLGRRVAWVRSVELGVTRQVDGGECVRDVGAEWVCRWRGQLVTRWTGEAEVEAPALIVPVGSKGPSS